MFTALQSIKLQKLQSIFKESFPQRSQTHPLVPFFILSLCSLGDLHERPDIIMLC